VRRRVSQFQMSIQELIPILQIAIGPVILISGVGLLLLSMTNRLGRVIDRSRQLSTELRLTKEKERPIILSQIRILSVRALLVRQAITLATISLLLAATLVITLFVAAVFRWEVGFVVVILFICCMGCLIGALVAFLRDINLSLAALKLELEPLEDEG
jgi:hypothetical protein